MDLPQVAGTAGEQLKGHRLRAGLTQDALAARAGVSVRTLRDIEQDRVRQPSMRVLRDLATALELDAEDRAHLLSPVDGRLHIGVLGPLAVRRGPATIDIRPAKQRLLLGLLAIQPGQAVRVDEIVDVLWHDRAPRTYLDLIHTYAARLRRHLEPGRPAAGPTAIRWARGAYRLELAHDQLDIGSFDELTARAWQARDAGDLAGALHLFERALRCWRGRVLGDGGTRLGEHPAALALGRRRLSAALALADIAIDLGRHEPATELLLEIAEAEALHEGLPARLMLLLAGAGQQAAAVRLFHDVRARLAEELGVEPGAEIQAAYLRVLRQEVAAAPHPAGPAAVPAQLPADVADFTGRRAELHRLGAPGGPATGPDGGVVIAVVTGAPGVGKTALVVHWAHQVAWQFSDGQLYLDLRGHSDDPPVPPIQALRYLLAACGVAPPRIPTDVDAAGGLLRSVLAGRRVLLVLDNAGSADQVRPLLPGGPGGMVLITSRNRLDGLVATHGARQLALDRLSQAEAGCLLARILGDDRVRAEPAATATLADLCGHLPLALRIAAARLVAAGATIAEYVDGLRAGRRVAMLAIGDDERSAAVERTFDTSYRSLSTVEQGVFRAIGSAPGADVTAESAAALAGVTSTRAGEVLARLMRAHLVEQRAPGRYQLHDLLRLYARDRGLAEDSAGEREAALRRLLDRYAESAVAAAHMLYPQMIWLHCPPRAGDEDDRFTGHAAALAWLDAERENLVAAVTAAAERPWPAVGYLAYALRGYLEHGRYLDDWVAVARAGLAATVAAGDRRGEAACRISLGTAYGYRTEFDETLDCFAAAMATARAEGWLDIQAVVSNGLVIMYGQTGRLDQAARHGRAALKLYRRFGRPDGVARVLYNLGTVHIRGGWLTRAATYLVAAFELAERTGPLVTAPLALEGLGMVSHALGRPRPAIAYLSRALTRYRQAGHRAGEASALHRLAAAHLDLGQRARARAMVGAALALAWDIGHGIVRIEALIMLGYLQLRGGDPGRATGSFTEALDLAGTLRQSFAEVQALLGLAETRLRLGDTEGAVAGGRRALVLARRGGFRLLEVRAVRLLAQARLR